MSQASGGKHIFLSYASKDRAIAAAIARAIESHGFLVWWDVDIPTGVHYPKFIEDALKTAACVVVLWSRNSTASRWVRNEANWGAENDTLIPVIIDDVEIPWEFQNFQTLDLSDWSGDGHEEVFAPLIEGLRRRARGTAPPLESSRIPRGRSPRESNAERSRKSRRWPGFRLSPLVIVLLIVGAASVTGMIVRFGRPTSKGRTTAEGLSFTPLTVDGHTRSAGLSPDGKYLAYAPINGDRSSLQLKQIDTGSESTLVEEDRQGIRSPIFSPDGVYIYFAMAGPTFSLSPDAEYDLYRISMLGGVPQRIVAKVIGRRFACSPDGTQLVFKRAVRDSTFIQIASTDGSNERSVARMSRSLSAAPCCLAWSHLDDTIITTTRDPVTGFVSLLALPITGGVARSIGDRPWQAILDIHSLADNTGLLVVGCPASEEMTANVNLWYLPRGESAFHRITSDMNFYSQVSVDKSGGKLALTYYLSKRALRVLDVAGGGGYRDVSTDFTANGRVAWAAPGRLITNQRVGSQIGIMNIDPTSGAMNRIPTSVSYVADLNMSADGKHIVYTSFHGSDFSVWMSGSDGSNPKRLTDEVGDEQFAQFSPDCSWIVTMYRSAKGRPWVIRKRLLATGATGQLCDEDARWPRISPDGSMVAAYFLSPKHNQYALAVIPSVGGEPRFLDIPESYEMLNWNHSGTGFTCYSRTRDALHLYDVSLTGGAPRQLAEISTGPETITDAAWNSAGDSLALCLQMTSFDVMLLQGLRGKVPALRP